MKVEQSKSHWKGTWWPESDEEENEEKTEMNEEMGDGNEDQDFDGYV